MHVSWPSIESFEHIRSNQKKRFLRVSENLSRRDDKQLFHQLQASKALTITYKAKIKIHGTNAAVSYLSESEDQQPQVRAQSRNRVLVLPEDQFGFSQWVHENQTFFEDVLSPLKGKIRVLFGEWAGGGINKGASVCRLPTKVFTVFALRVDDVLIVDPQKLSSILKPSSGSIRTPSNLYVLPWYREQKSLHDMEVIVDLLADNVPAPSPAFLHLESELNRINENVEQIDKLDPFILQTFNVSGAGEGLVFYPLSVTSSIDNLGLFEEEETDEDLGPEGCKEVRDQLAQTKTELVSGKYVSLLFKCKGPSHQVVQKGKSAQLEPEIAQTVSQFVQIFVTPQRCEQGVYALFASDKAGSGVVVEFTKKQIPVFLKWMLDDILKEAKAELEASGLLWTTVKGPITEAARKWFLQKAQ